MVTNAKAIIIGSGISGILCAKILSRRGIPFTLLEKNDHLGGRATEGHHRCYSQETLDYLRDWMGALEWETIEDSAVLRQKGEFNPIASAPADAAGFYLRQPFFFPRFSYAEVAKKFLSEFASQIALEKSVVEIDPGSSTVKCQDGSVFEYSQVYWCGPIEVLLKCWKGDKFQALKNLKKMETPRGGLSIEFSFSEQVLEQQNAVLFVFRHKDAKIQAIGVKPALSSTTLQWLLFLEDEVSSDHEEVAKVVRTFKRELFKEFPLFKEKQVEETIHYEPLLSGETPVSLKEPEIFRRVFYVGPQVSYVGEDTPLRNLDLAVANCHFVESRLPLETLASPR